MGFGNAVFDRLGGLAIHAVGEFSDGLHVTGCGLPYEGGGNIVDGFRLLLQRAFEGSFEAFDALWTANFVAGFYRVPKALIYLGKLLIVRCFPRNNAFFQAVRCGDRPERDEQRSRICRRFQPTVRLGHLLGQGLRGNRLVVTPGNPPSYLGDGRHVALAANVVQAFTGSEPGADGLDLAGVDGRDCHGLFARKSVSAVRVISGTMLFPMGLLLLTFMTVEVAPSRDHTTTA